MKGFISFLLFLSFVGHLSAQEKCQSASWLNEELKNNSSFRARLESIEAFNNSQTDSRTNATIYGVIRIPVVVHILYHSQDEKISDAAVIAQIEALNKYFRRRNADTINAPAHFRQLGADCEIEFKLAISDPTRRSTSGIIKKYTPILSWKADDQMKFSSSMGADAWNPAQYLNIWVCNLDRFAGYATMPGTDMSKDGVVIDFSAFGVNSGTSGYNLGKTAVHEVGHWLNLRHIWGDQYCGDDGVDDTPKQANYTVGCPKTVRVTCGNSPHGDMYMNYMDYTNDDCINLFTLGQKARMRKLFETGGARNSMLNSKGLMTPLIQQSSLPEEEPKWLHVQLFPNPAVTSITVDLMYDARWLGKTIFISNAQGQNVMNVQITSKRQQIDVSKLQPGIYFLAAKKEDGESIKQRFVKL